MRASSEYSCESIERFWNQNLPNYGSCVRLWYSKLSIYLTYFLYMVLFKVIIRGCICHTYDFPCSLLLLKVFMKSMITLITMRSFKDIWLLRCPRNILWKHESISKRRRIWAISWFCWCMITSSPRMFRKI